MSQFLDRLMFFRKNVERFSDGWGVVTRESRSWEKGYRDRWNHDKIVRSTHGVNCTGSCSWKIYVKSGLITWETQQTDYPRTRPQIPNHEPRGCPRGASYSWYIYSAARVNELEAERERVRFEGGALTSACIVPKSALNKAVRHDPGPYHRARPDGGSHPPRLIGSFPDIDACALALRSMRIEDAAIPHCRC